ncbi:MULTISPECIES: extracellular solute-binding protein [Microbacterium]|uniref:ABC transporter substrate-binding protein n=1 Tax=Microbacterium TaxID=33882 RepID=UPI00146E4A0E|nr:MULTISPECIES: extracellular solute-binding protein [Microbacterium]
MRRRMPLAAVALAVGAVTLSACAAGGSTSTGSGGNGEDVELTFFTFETPNLTPEYWDEAVARASAEVPGVKINRIVGENSLDYLQKLWSSGQAPDIIVGGPALEPFVAKGQLASWSEDEMGELEVPANFVGEIDGKVYALPQIGAQTIPLVYYNADLFAKAGIKEAPGSWDELVETCEQLTDAGIKAIEVGGGGGETWVTMVTSSAIIQADVLGEDPEWFDKRGEGEVSFSDDEFVAAAQKVADLSEKGCYDTDGLSRTYAETEQAFRDQKAAMYPMGNWFAAAADTTPLDFELGVFAMPGESGNPMPVVTGPGLAVNAEAPDVDLAKKWALAFQTNEKNVQANIKTDGGLVGEEIELPDGLGDAYLATNDAYREALANDETVPAAFYIQGVTPPGFATAIEPAVVDLINLRMTAEEFGAFLDQKWDELEVE